MNFPGMPFGSSSGNGGQVSEQEQIEKMNKMVS
jgi:hypothetical protein